jgi:hypothetical protein
MVNSIAHDDANRKANNRDLLYMQLKQRRIIDSSSSAAFEIIATLLGFIFQSESLRFVVLPRLLHALLLHCLEVPHLVSGRFDEQLLLLYLTQDHLQHLVE